MKICYLNNQYPKVSHTFIRREIQALESLGASVLRVCARQNAEGLIDKEDLDELKLTHSIAQGKIASVLWVTLITLLTHPVKFLKASVKAFKMGVKDELKVHKYLIYLAEACYLRTLCEQHQIQHIHAHFGTNPAAVALLCRALGGPGYSFTVHGPEEFDRPQSLSLSDKIADASFVVAISYFCQSQLYRWCKTLDDWTKIRIVRCALNDTSFLNTSELDATKKSLLAIGRLSEQKGFPLLMEAAARLKEEGVEFDLNIVGDGPMREEMENMIANNALAGNVKLLGYKSGSEVVELLDRSRCLLVPSFAEGLPVVVMEALARKRPVIATQIAAMCELVENKVNGWVIPPGNTEALVLAMKSCLNEDLEALVKMGELGWEKVSQQHNSLREAKKLLAFITEAVEGGRHV